MKLFSFACQPICCRYFACSGPLCRSPPPPLPSYLGGGQALAPRVPTWPPLYLLLLWRTLVEAVAVMGFHFLEGGFVGGGNEYHRSGFIGRRIDRVMLWSALRRCANGPIDRSFGSALQALTLSGLHSVTRVPLVPSDFVSASIPFFCFP